MATRQPHEYPRRVLLAAAGLSPQIVTETLYALIVQTNPAFVPTEVHLVTTAEGAERARLQLLSEEPGWFHRFCREYQVDGINFAEDNIHIIVDHSGRPLEDIRTDHENSAAADFITRLVQQFTADPDAALHVSLAGGRKTIGFYLGYALSLFGREQDRLSHVLVEPPYESHHEFFYPSKTPRIIYTSLPDSRPLDTSKARITLAHIPFVRLRHGLPEDLLKGRITFAQAVRAAQASFAPPHLRIDLETRTVACGETKVLLPTVELAFYAWIAWRQLTGQPPMCPREYPGSTRIPDRYRQYAQEFLKIYARLAGWRSTDRTTRSLEKGMTKQYFLEHRSKIHNALRQALGYRAHFYEIQCRGPRGRGVYLLNLDPHQIELIGCPLELDEHNSEEEQK